METENKPFVSMQNVSKHFGTVMANSHVNLDVRKGEILALLGENGSGKSTLMNMLSGIYAPDEGVILVDNKPLPPGGPINAIRAGVGMVHQHFKLVEVFTALENIVAGTDTGFFLNKKALLKKAQTLADEFGLSVDCKKKVYEMSVGEKQTVEILKMLYRGARVLILDEPTAVLTPQETTVLFDILRNMKKAGCAIILITHKLNEVMDVSDRVSVLRRGEAIATVATSETTEKELTELMVGKKVELSIDRPLCETSVQPVLEISGLTKAGESRFGTLDDLTFSIKGGEILGIAGIAGSGQRELCEIIAGLDKATGGSVRFQGEEILGMNPIEILRRGVSMSFVPEDRLGMGLVGSMDLVSNVMLRTFQKNKGVFLDRKAGRDKTVSIINQYHISTPSPEHVLAKLSGGNIQKVLLGREVDLNPALLITAYPVRGLDIGASYQVYDILNEQKKKGVAILFIGEDLDVLLALCDRLMVLHDGRNMGILNPAKTTKEEIGMLMLGRTQEEKVS